MRNDVPGRAVGILAVALLSVGAGCGRSSTRAPDASLDASSPEGGTAPRARSTDVWLDAAKRGQAAIEALVASPRDRAQYLELRRAALASMYVWRRAISFAASGAFGPEIVYGETAGRLGALDLALTAGDERAASASLVQLRGAFAVARSGIEERGIPDARAAQALSDSAYALGQAIAESTGFVPDGDDAALADVLGLLDAVDRGGRSLGFDLDSALASFAPLRSARTLAEVANRLVLLRATGELGARIRASAEAQGFFVRAPYVAADGTPAVSALTLPRPSVPLDPAKAAIGARLFRDVHLSARGTRACATCHVERLAFTDGRAAPVSLDPSQPLRRSTPTLLFAPLEARLMWDGRARTADAQAIAVIHNKAEMGQDDAAMTAAIAHDASYRGEFAAAFGHEPGIADVGAALEAYEASAFVPLDAPIDKFARGELAAFDDEVSRGFDVFAGIGRCARCHVPPVFAGSRPPDFTAPIFSVLGVPAGPGSAVLDPDPGRFASTHLARDRSAFRTPTVRDAGLTAPYFHNGRFATLASVLDFYDRGGGRGLGLSVPNQDPDVRPLHLSASDKRALLAFLDRALTNTLGARSSP